MALLRFLFADIPQKVIALLIALFLWFVAALDRIYITSFPIPVEIGEKTSAKIITGFKTRSVTVTIEGKGRDIVGLRLRSPEFRLSVPDSDPGVRHIRLDPADLDLPKTLALRSITPDHIELELHKIGHRTVEVQVPVKGQLPKGLAVASIAPAAEVTLVGPEEDITLFASVTTESLNLGAIRENDTVRLHVFPPLVEGFSTKPETLPVVVLVEKEAARIFLNIQVRTDISRPGSIRVEPAEAQIAVAGPSSWLDKLKPSDIVARIRTADLEPGTHRLAAEIILPPGFHLVRCEPALFDVTVK